MEEKKIKEILDNPKIKSVKSTYDFTDSVHCWTGLLSNLVARLYVVAVNGLDGYNCSDEEQFDAIFLMRELIDQIDKNIEKCPKLKPDPNDLDTSFFISKEEKDISNISIEILDEADIPRDKEVWKDPILRNKIFLELSCQSIPQNPNPEPAPTNPNPENNGQQQPININQEVKIPINDIFAAKDITPSAVTMIDTTKVPQTVDVSINGNNTIHVSKDTLNKHLPNISKVISNVDKVPAMKLEEIKQGLLVFLDTIWEQGIRDKKFVVDLNNLRKSNFVLVSEDRSVTVQVITRSGRFSIKIKEEKDKKSSKKDKKETAQQQPVEQQATASAK